MVRYCAVRGCRSKSLSSSVKSSGLSFHCLPNDAVVAQDWLSAMDNPCYQYSEEYNPCLFKHVTICSKHFELDNFSVTESSRPLQYRRRKLKRGAVPTLKLPQSSKKVTMQNEKCQKRLPATVLQTKASTINDCDRLTLNKTPPVDLKTFKNGMNSWNETMKRLFINSINNDHCYAERNMKNRYRYRKLTRACCSAVSCSANKLKDPELQFFLFPKEKSRCKLWLKNCKLLDLTDKYGPYYCSSWHVCSKHFENCMFTTPYRTCLTATAIPTLFYDEEEARDLTNFSRKKSTSRFTECHLSSRNAKSLAVEETNLGIGDSNSVNRRTGLPALSPTLLPSIKQRKRKFRVAMPITIPRIKPQAFPMKPRKRKFLLTLDIPKIKTKFEENQFSKRFKSASAVEDFGSESLDIKSYNSVKDFSFKCVCNCNCIHNPRTYDRTKLPL